MKEHPGMTSIVFSVSSNSTSPLFVGAGNQTDLLVVGGAWLSGRSWVAPLVTARWIRSKKAAAGFPLFQASEAAAIAS